MYDLLTLLYSGLVATELLTEGVLAEETAFCVLVRSCPDLASGDVDTVLLVSAAPGYVLFAISLSVLLET